jgi:membrane associated rhomboid family serine protease
MASVPVLPSPFPMSHHRRAVRVRLEHANGSKPKSGAFPHLTGRTVVILMSAFAATTGWGWGGTMTWIMFGVGTALGVGIGVAIGACVTALIIGWWDRDADRAVRRRYS